MDTRVLYHYHYFDVHIYNIMANSRAPKPRPGSRSILDAAPVGEGVLVAVYTPVSVCEPLEPFVDTVLLLVGRPGTPAMTVLEGKVTASLS